MGETFATQKLLTLFQQNIGIFEILTLKFLWNVYYDIVSLEQLAHGC